MELQANYHFQETVASRVTLQPLARFLPDQCKKRQHFFSSSSGAQLPPPYSRRRFGDFINFRTPPATVPASALPTHTHPPHNSTHRPAHFAPPEVGSTPPAPDGDESNPATSGDDTPIPKQPPPLPVSGHFEILLQHGPKGFPVDALLEAVQRGEFPGDFLATLAVREESADGAMMLAFGHPGQCLR